MRQAVYVKINDNYTATVYSLSDLKDYVKREKLNPATFTIHKRDTGNKELTKEVSDYIRHNYYFPTKMKANLRKFQEVYFRTSEIEEMVDSIDKRLDLEKSGIEQLRKEYKKLAKKGNRYASKITELDYQNMRIDLCMGFEEFQESLEDGGGWFSEELSWFD